MQPARHKRWSHSCPSLETHLHTTSRTGPHESLRRCVSSEARVCVKTLNPKLAAPQLHLQGLQLACQPSTLVKKRNKINLIQNKENMAKGQIMASRSNHGLAWAGSIGYVGVVSFRQLPLGQRLQRLHQQRRVLRVDVLHSLHPPQDDSAALMVASPETRVSARALCSRVLLGVQVKVQGALGTVSRNEHHCRVHLPCSLLT